MSRLVPILTEAVTRAWGLDDPRVLSHLRAENQPGATRRATAVKDRARACGWPVEVFTSKAAREAQIRALRRMERMDWSHQGRQAASLARRTIESRVGGYTRIVNRARRDGAFDADLLADDGLVSIFDE